MLVVDSVAALVPKAELDGEMGDSHMGLQARLMSQALRKLTGTVSKSRTCLIFINQIREKIGVMFGNPETTTGGRALKFYSSVRIDIRRIAAIKDGDQVVGSRTKVKIVKNKTAAPFREAEFDIMYGEGISREGDMLDVAVERNIVEKSGAWYSFDGERIGQGRENTKNFLKENKDVAARIELAVRKALGLDKAAAEAPADPLPVSPKEVAAAKAAVPEEVKSGRGNSRGAERSAPLSSPPKYCRDRLRCILPASGDCFLVAHHQLRRACIVQEPLQIGDPEASARSAELAWVIRTCLPFSTASANTEAKLPSLRSPRRAPPPG